MLKIKFKHKPMSMAKADITVAQGPEGRISKMRKLVTALVRHERIEGRTQHIEESRGYAERLIQMAVSRGDKDQEMMNIANYWLLEKDLIHKLFKVLVPRYKDHPSSFTSYYRLPDIVPEDVFKNGVSLLELKKNPWPPVRYNARDVSGSLLNVLLYEAKNDYRKQKLEDYTDKREKELSEQAKTEAYDADAGTDVDAVGTEAALGKDRGEDLIEEMYNMELKEDPSEMHELEIEKDPSSNLTQEFKEARTNVGDSTERH